MLGYLFTHFAITLMLLKKSSVEHKRRRLVESSRCSCFEYNECKWRPSAVKLKKKKLYAI